MLIGAMLSVGATIVGISFVQFANGYLGTLVSMQTAAAGYSPVVVGIVLASYFGGYTLGAATIASVLHRVGHIRLFAALAGLVAASIAVQPIFTSAPAWIAIRLVTGLGCAGLFITAESWLNASSTSLNRGTIFAIYMVATNAAFGLGQFMLNIPTPGGYELFAVAAALFCLALVPVSLTHAVAPSLSPSPRLKIRELRWLAPVAVAGCAASGLVGSTFYTLMPAYAQTQGIAPGAVSAYIATAIFGGLVFQLPIGWLSDRFDRRLVAAGVASGLCITAVTLALIPLSATSVLIVSFLLGGFMSTIYPVCVAHANDRVDADKIVSVSGQLILINGMASFLGPIVGTSVLGVAGINAVFIHIGIIGFLFVAFALWRSLRVESPDHKERPFIILSERMGQQTAHIADEPESAAAAPGNELSDLQTSGADR